MKKEMKRDEKRETLAEALKRHFRINKAGKVLSPDEGDYFLCAITALEKGSGAFAV